MGKGTYFRMGVFEKLRGLHYDWLCFVPIFRGDARLAKYLSDQTHGNVADMGVGNTNLLASFDHELVLAA